MRQPEVERNAQHVYVRWNHHTVQAPPMGEEEQPRTVWEHDEIYMTDNEYSQVQTGLWNGEWNDALRSIERAALYDRADRMISKYGTDVPDDAKRTAWIGYKHAVRETQDAPGYPQTVTYPDEPESD